MSFSTKKLCAFLGEINCRRSVSVDPKKLKEQKVGKNLFNSLIKDLAMLFQSYKKYDF